MWGVTILNILTDIQESDRKDCFTYFELQYRYDVGADQYNAVVTRTPLNSGILSRARVVIGDVYMTAMESEHIADDWVANFVIDWLVFHQSMPHYYFEVEVPTAVALKLRLGWNVALYIRQGELDLNGTSATVVMKGYRRHTSTLGLVIWWANLANIGLGGASGSVGPGSSGGQ